MPAGSIKYKFVCGAVLVLAVFLSSFSHCLAQTLTEYVDVTATVETAFTLSSINPNSVVQNSSAFTLTVTGAGFDALSVVRLDGSDRTTTFVSSTEMTAQIPASDLTTAGTRSINIWSSTLSELSNTINLSVTAVAPPPSGGGDTLPPIITNVQAIDITETSARITWDTNEPATSYVAYGTTVGYGQSITNSSLILSHGHDLSGLSPNTTYHFIVTSRDQYNNSSNSSDYTFTTAVTEPLLISNVTSTSITDTSAVVVWDTNHVATSKIEYGTTQNFGSWNYLVGSVLNHSISLVGLSQNTIYYYQVISQDQYSQNATSTIRSFRTGADTTPPTNVTLNATPGNIMVLLTWVTPPEPDFAGTRLVRTLGAYPTGPQDGTLVYNGSATTFLDTGLTNGTTYFYGAYSFDYNGNYSSGALASATPSGTLPVQPPTTTPPIPPTTPVPPIPPIPPTTPVSTIPPVVPPTGGVIPTSTQPGIPGQAAIHPLYFASNGTVVLQPDANGYFGVLGETSVLVYVPTSNLGSTAKSGIMTIGNHTYSLALNDDGTAYTGTFLSPADQGFIVNILVNFQNGITGSSVDYFAVVPQGQVFEEQFIQGLPISVPNSIITLYQNQNGNWIPWNATAYGQYNPTISNKTGHYSFIVPNGQYYAEVEKDGYMRAYTPYISITNNVFGNNVPLIRIPPPIAATSTFPFVENLPEQAAYAAVIVKSILRQPKLVNAVDDYAAPTLFTISILNTAGALPLINLLSYLQFLFTQPILLFARRKKRRWGIIYNSLSKQPVEFAVVRLIHSESRLIVQTRVSDKFGRYVFYPQQGEYLLEITKPGFTFPTQYLADAPDDGQYTDLYHGEVIVAEREDAVIAYNIAMDPTASVETPKRVIYISVLRKLQHLIALSGSIISLAALIISPSWIIAVLLIVQIAFYLLFRRLALPAKAKPWGRVLDNKTKQPIKNAIVRIFDRKFNKLLETQITDAKGRYGFFADKNTFYITVERPGYSKF
ncbi:MAG: fibronectin type III domain-containing protein [Patescibacteria group bacterium]